MYTLDITVQAKKDIAVLKKSGGKAAEAQKSARKEAEA